MKNMETLIVPDNGTLLYFCCDGTILNCFTFEFKKSACGFTESADCESDLTSFKDTKWSLLACGVVTDAESFIEVPCALLSCRTKSKEYFRLFSVVAGKLTTCQSWKHHWEEGSGSMNVELGDGPSVLVPNGNYLMYHDRRTVKSFENINLAKYFSNLTEFDIISTRMTIDNTMLVLMMYKSSSSDAKLSDSNYGLFTIENGVDPAPASSVLKTCDITHCIPPIYSPVILNVECLRLVLKNDQQGNQTVHSEVYAITSAKQIVKFVDGRLKECGPVKIDQQLNSSRLKIFTSTDQSYACVTTKENCFVISLSTYEIVHQLPYVSYVFTGDFLGTGAEQAVFAEDGKPSRWRNSILIDGSTWYFHLNKELQNETEESDNTDIATNSKTAMKALSNRLRSGRGHLLEMKREVTLRDQVIDNICAEITTNGSDGNMVVIQDDLINPFGDDEVLPVPCQPCCVKENSLEVSNTWVRTQTGEIIFGVVVTNLSDKALVRLQLIVTQRICSVYENVKSVNKVMLIGSNQDKVKPGSSTKKRKKEWSIGMQDVCVSTQLLPGHIGHVVSVLPKVVLNKAVCDFDASLTWCMEDGPVLFEEVPPFEVKVTEMFEGSKEVKVTEGNEDKDVQQELVDLAAFFSTSSLTDLVIKAKYSSLGTLETILTCAPLTYNERWSFWNDNSVSCHFPCVCKGSENDSEIVMKVAYRDTSQLTLLLVHLYEVLPCDVTIQPCSHRCLSSCQAELLKGLHREVSEIKGQLGRGTRAAAKEDSPVIDFSGGVESLRKQVELKRQRLSHKRKLSDDQMVQVLSQTIRDLQVHTDKAAQKLVVKCDSL